MISDKRYRHCRSVSPVTRMRGIKDERRERYLHTLIPQNTYRTITSSCKQRIPEFSPERCKYRVQYKEHKPLKIYRSKLDEHRSSSEVSITSVESCIYSSPKKTIEKNKRYKMEYRRTFSPSPKSKIKKDLFVIPQHTCHKSSYEKHSHRSYKTTAYWNVIKDFSCSPEYKHYMHKHRSSEKSRSYGTSHSTPWKSEYQKFESSTSVPKRTAESHQRRGQEQIYPQASPKHILHPKYATASTQASDIKGKFGINNSKSTHYRESRKERHEKDENLAKTHTRHLRHSDKIPEVHNYLKHEIRQESPEDRLFKHKPEKDAKIHKSWEVKSDSKSSDKTFPFLPSDSERRGIFSSIFQIKMK